jgi:hypothetical protein
MSSVLAFYNYATVKAAHAATQRAETIHLTAAEMSAGEFKDYYMYEHSGLEFFPAYNQLWHPSPDGGFCMVVVQSYEGTPTLSSSSSAATSLRCTSRLRAYA